MKRPIVILLLLAAAALPLHAADEIYLKSGKILSGKIVGESDHAYRLRLGMNMYLNVEKNEVTHIFRQTPRVRKTPAKTAKKAAPPTPAAPPPPPAEPDTKTVKRTVGVVDLTMTVQPAYYDVRGRTMAAVMRTITDREKGVGFIVYGQRRPSHTTWRVSWYGKPTAIGNAWQKLVVVATVTPNLPAWTPAPARREADAWAAMIKERERIEAEHAQIIQETLTSFAESASNLNATDEKALREQTAQLITDFRARADLRRKGYDRRRLEPKRPLRRRPKR